MAIVFIKDRNVACSSAWTRSRREQGFSMLEVLVVVSIIFVLMLIALPQLLDVRQDYRLNAVAREVSGIMSQARIMAVRENEDHRVLVADSGTYLLQEDVSGSWTTESTHEMPDGFTIGATGSIAEFHARGNAGPVNTFTITNPNANTRDVVVETSGRSYVQ